MSRPVKIVAAFVVVGLAAVAVLVAVELYAMHREASYRLPLVIPENDPARKAPK